MPEILESDVSLHTDQHDLIVIFPIVNSSDEAGHKDDKAGDNSYDGSAKRVPQNPDTSSTSKRDKRQKTKKRKGNFQEIVKRSNKKLKKKSRSRQEKRKRSPSSSSSSSSLSSSSSTGSENEIVDKMFKIISKGEKFGLELAPRILARLSKVPMAVLRQANIGIINYPNDMLLMGKTLSEIIMTRDTLIFLLQHLSFLVDLKN